MTQSIFSFCLLLRSNAWRAYSESGVSSSVSSVISKPNNGKSLYLYTARSLWIQQRPSGRERRGLSSMGSLSISFVNLFSFQRFTNFASNLWRTIITLLVKAIFEYLELGLQRYGL